MASLPAAAPLTEEEYLTLERQALDKSEYHDGQMFAMAGGSPNHSFIQGAVFALLFRQAPPGCRAFTADLRIHLEVAKTYSYADCGIVCGDLELSSDQKDNLLNPLLIVEVLSPSSQDYERGKKFELYRTIASFREYVVVHQDRWCIEHYSRQDDGSWLLREYSGDGASVPIARLGIHLPLAEVYAATV